MFLNRFSEIISTFFYVGKIKKAPGTWGTLAAIPLWFLLAHFSVFTYMGAVMFLLIAGIFLVQLYESQLNSHDAKEIVFDEVVGYLISMTWLPLTWQSMVLGFVLFRFFDILKPPPIRQLDAKIEGGVGVMLDDVAAGIITNIILQIIYSQTSWLGAQTQVF